MSSLSEQFGFTDSDLRRLMGATLNTNIIEIFVYGIYTTVYAITMWQIVSNGFKKRGIMAILVTLMWCMATIHSALRWNELEFTFIEHGATREDQFDARFADGFRALRILSGVSAAVNIFIADAIVIWRCWIIWGSNWLIILVPCLINIVGRFQDGGERTLYNVNWNFVYFAMTLATNGLCTLLIVFRILRVSGPRARTYRGVIEILVESAALYSVSYLVYIGLLAKSAFYDPDGEDLSYAYMRSLLYSITGIAPTLILVRVVAGHARPDDSWTHGGGGGIRSALRSLHFVTHTGSSASSRSVMTLDLEHGVVHWTSGDLTLETEAKQRREK
ncbi:hypothetical protein BDZ89DRAFT_1135045 [Hymenopellis radicata]|nr:hypothetical protein BDZ89DRAFT_1135045 [Hymenopellis radicata]